MKFITTVLIILLSFIFNIRLQAATGTWSSSATGGTINYTVTEASSPAKDYSGAYMTVVYLENLNFKKLGGNTNATDVSWLLSKGYRVIELNYAKHANAISPNINMDIIAINTAINSGSFCGLTTCSKYRSYVLFEGYRIARDVPYFVEDPTVYNYSTTTTDSLRMDIVYPANTSATVPAIISFSYCNSYSGDANVNQRLNLGNTLAGFKDSFLEGAPANGMAWAICDHPKFCPWGNGKPTGSTVNKVYTSFETNPDAARKVKSAIRTLRAKGAYMGMSGKIGVFGFSRGSDAGSIAVGDRSVSDFENSGFNIGVSDDVQVAGLGSGVFDFTYIYNTTGDGDSNLETNCPVAWGPLASNYDKWKLQGSYYLTQTVASAPVIFFYNTTDAVYYKNQIQHFQSHLDSLGVPTSVITDYATGHAVPQTTGPLSTLYNFFVKYLTPPSLSTGVNDVIANNDFQLHVNSSANGLNIQYCLNSGGKVKAAIYNMDGKEIVYKELGLRSAGAQEETIGTTGKLPAGNYILKLSCERKEAATKFIY